MAKFGHPDRRVVAVLAIAGIMLFAMAATARLAGMRINTSYSLPLGIYQMGRKKDRVPAELR